MPACADAMERGLTIFKLLLDAGMDINTCDFHGWSVLTYLLRCGQAERIVG